MTVGKLRRGAVITGEEGFALPTVMLMMVAALALATAAAVTSISSQRGTVHDQQQKSAFAAAESGLSDAMLRFNLNAAGTPCAPVSGSVPDAGGWCAPVDLSQGVNGSTVRYWVHPPSATPSRRCPASPTSGACMEVVSIGTLNGVTRRIDATATSASGQPLFFDAAVKAQNWIHMDSNAEVHSGVATNGDITLNSNAKQCGAASVGVGHALSTNANAAYYSNPNCTQPTSSYLQQPLTLPPVNQGDAPSRNDNGRLFSLDTISGNKSDACFNGVKGDGSAGSCGARELSINNNSSVTLGGSIYSLCKLTMGSYSKLYTAVGANVKIYFDSPEACGQPSGTVQMQLSSNTRITTPSTSASSVALLFVGSTSRATSIQLNSNTAADALCQQNFVIYAPLTDINFNSNSYYCGAVAGKTVQLNSYSVITTGAGTSGFTLPNTAAYYIVDPTGYVECSAAATSPPNGGC
ncbi:MAG: PilX N-terminal domain-containing pilus assembly protein [Solirubrobacterales bacterium]